MMHEIKFFYLYNSYFFCYRIVIQFLIFESPAILVRFITFDYPLIITFCNNLNNSISSIAIYRLNLLKYFSDLIKHFLFQFISVSFHTIKIKTAIICINFWCIEICFQFDLRSIYSFKNKFQKIITLMKLT